jgi:hypothetical protein
MKSSFIRVADSYWKIKEKNSLWSYQDESIMNREISEDFWIEEKNSLGKNHTNSFDNKNEKNQFYIFTEIMEQTWEN